MKFSCIGIATLRQQQWWPEQRTICVQACSIANHTVANLESGILRKFGLAGKIQNSNEIDTDAAAGAAASAAASRKTTVKMVVKPGAAAEAVSEAAAEEAAAPAAAASVSISFLSF